MRRLPKQTVDWKYPRDVQTACTECGLVTEDGTQGCGGIFDRLLARDFSNALYFRMHRMLVDTYALQHPARYCASAKSLAAHLAGLGWFMRHPDASRAVGPESLQRWLSGRTDVVKPDLPTFRGTLTIGDIDDSAGPLEYGQAVERWARATWDAYLELHSTADRWIREAESAHRGTRHTARRPRPPGT